MPKEKVAFVAGMLLPLALIAFTVVRVPLTTKLPETNRYELALIYTLALNMALAPTVTKLAVKTFAPIVLEVKTKETTLDVIVVEYMFVVITFVVEVMEPVVYKFPVLAVPVITTFPVTLAVPVTVKAASGVVVFIPTWPALANIRLVLTVRPFLTTKELLLIAIPVPFPQSTLSIIYNNSSFH